MCQNTIGAKLCQLGEADVDVELNGHGQGMAELLGCLVRRGYVR